MATRPIGIVDVDGGRRAVKLSLASPCSGLVDLAATEPKNLHEPAFMPVLHQDPSATLRGDPRNIARKTGHANANKRQVDLSQTSDSSASSTPASAAPRRDVHVRGDRPVGPLSPRRTAELAGTGRGSGKGSDGTPSMGSSFSDLDGMFSKEGAGGGLLSD